MGYTALVQRLGHQRWFAAMGRRLTPLDRRVQRWTRGRWSVAGRQVLPELLLTTTGRRSGLPRTQPLLYVRDGEAYVVVGSNWGQAHHPAWSTNLLATPDAALSVDGQEVPVRATLVTGAERDRLWGLLARVWPAYDTYDRRAAGRELRMFSLSPKRASTAPDSGE
jgi:deazaflavin-dependent oxidoreductase (nitroreductase family)